MGEGLGDVEDGAEGNADEERSGFAFVVHPSATEDDLNRMVQAMGGIPTAKGDPLFPGSAHQARCRVCGLLTEMTEEHLPPRGAFNKQTGREIDAFSLIGTDSLEVPEGGSIVQGGIRGYMLCADCNHPKWAREYQEWAHRAYHLLASQDRKPPEVDPEPGFPGIGRVTFKGVYPGRLIRQVLSMMAAISGSADLTDAYPVIRELVLGGPAQPLPDPLRVHFLLYGDNTSRIAGGPTGQAIFDVDAGILRRVLSVDFPPMAFVLTLEGPPHTQGVDISSFAEVDVSERQDVEFEGLPLGFGHKPLPLDYRTLGQIIAEGDHPEDAIEGAR